MAQWLNTAFYNVDFSAFSFTHGLAKTCGGFLTPFMNVLAFLGKGGWAFIVMGIILLAFRKTRRAGVCVLIALLMGAILTNVIIKNAVARPRPFAQNQKYNEWWQFVGSSFEKEWSFPSGHVTATMASMTALFFIFNKKWSWVFFLGTILMGFCRVYLVVHYLTDVIGGLIIGLIGGACAYFSVKAIFKALEKASDKRFCKAILEFDLIEFIKNKK